MHTSKNEVWRISMNRPTQIKVPDWLIDLLHKYKFNGDCVTQIAFLHEAVQAITFRHTDLSFVFSSRERI